MEIIFIKFALPVMIVVGLPVMIVWLLTRMRINRDNKRYDIILESLKNNPNADPEKLAGMLASPELTPGERKNRILLRGCIWSLVGVATLAVDVYMLCSNKFPDAADNSLFLLLAGAISLAVGIAYIITYLITSKK